MSFRTIVGQMASSVARFDSADTIERAGPQRRGVRVFLYDAENEDRQLGIDDIHLEELEEHQLLWVDVSDRREAEVATSRLPLSPATVARITDGLTKPELFFHDSYFHMVVALAEQTPRGYEPSPLHCVVGKNWIVTLHNDRSDVLERFDERIRGDSPLGYLDAPALLATFLHEHVASYLRESEPFELELDSIDLKVMEGRAGDDAVFKALVAMRRRLAALRRLLAPHRELYALLARPDFEMLSGSDSMQAFALLDERTDQALQRLEMTREMIVSSFEIYTTWTAHGTNRVIKLLTVSSVALLPATLLASVMGMNSLPDALTTPAAFGITTIAMLALVATVIGGSWRRGWL